MDWLSISIILISILLAFLFKFVLMKRVREWVDRDLLRTLSAGDPSKLEQLNELDRVLKQKGVSRAERLEQIELLASKLN